MGEATARGVATLVAVCWLAACGAPRQPSPTDPADAMRGGVPCTGDDFDDADCASRPAQPPAVRMGGGPDPLSGAMTELEEREQRRLQRLLAEEATCPALCEALRRQLEAKRVACAMAPACSPEAIERLSTSDREVRERGCRCPVPAEDLTEQPR